MKKIMSLLIYVSNWAMVKDIRETRKTTVIFSQLNSHRKTYFFINSKFLWEKANLCFFFFLLFKETAQSCLLLDTSQQKKKMLLDF